MSWTERGAPSATTWRKRIGLVQLSSGVWAVTPYIRHRTRRFQETDEGILVLSSSLTTGKRLIKMDAVPALVFLED